MKVLVISNYYKPAYVYGGPVRCISVLFETLAKLDAQVTVFTTSANGDNRLDVPLGQPVRVDGIEVLYYPLVFEATRLGRSFFSPQLGKACFRRIREFDIVSLQGIWTYPIWYATKACRRHNIPYVVTLHGELMPGAMRRGRRKKQLYFDLFVRPYLNRSAAIHCTTPMELEDVEPFQLKAPKFVIPNSIDVSKYNTLPPRHSLLRKLSISENALVILFLGRLHPKKQPGIAVSALVAAQNLQQDVHLIMVGPDEANMKDRLVMQAQRAGCGDRLHFTGLLEGEDVLQAFAAANLLLMPSECRSENFGMSAAEALAAGVPVLVSDGVPVGHWAEEGGAGQVIPCSETAFVEATCKLLADPDRLFAMARQGPKVVRRYLDSSIVAQRTMDQYQAIISKSTPSPRS